MFAPANRDSRRQESKQLVRRLPQGIRFTLVTNLTLSKPTPSWPSLLLTLIQISGRGLHTGPQLRWMPLAIRTVPRSAPAAKSGDQDLWVGRHILEARRALSDLPLSTEALDRDPGSQVAH